MPDLQERQLYKHHTWHIRSMGSQNSSLSVRVCMSAVFSHGYCLLVATDMCQTAEMLQILINKLKDSKPKVEGSQEWPSTSNWRR